MVIEDHIISAAVSLSHGQNLDSVMDQLHSEIKACEDVLAHDSEASNWFDFSTPNTTTLASEIDLSPFLQNQSLYQGSQTYIGESYSLQAPRIWLTH